MDEFPHIAVEHLVLKRHVQFRFNPERCRQAGFEETPNADKYEVIKLRRVYHFNRDTSDHVVLTIPKPVFVVVDKDQIPEEISSKTSRNGDCTTGQQTTYQNVNQRKSESPNYCFDASENEVIIEKCVPEVISSNIYRKQTESFNNIPESYCDNLRPKSTINCDESKSKTSISEPNGLILNNQDDCINPIYAKEPPTNDEEVSNNISVHLELQPDDDSIQLQNHQNLSLEELPQVLQTNNKTIENESGPLSTFQELSIHDQILNENCDILKHTPIQQISADDENLWEKLYESNTEDDLKKAPPEFYESDSSRFDVVEEEMRKIHGEYVFQEHSYVKPFNSKEGTEFVNNTNASRLQLLKVQEPTLEENFEKDSKNPQLTDEAFGVHSEMVEHFTQENINQQEEPLDLRKEREIHNPQENCVMQNGVVRMDGEPTTADENTLMLDAFEKPIHLEENFTVQTNANGKPIHCEMELESMEKEVQSSAGEVSQLIQNSAKDETINLVNSDQISVMVESKSITKTKARIKVLGNVLLERSAEFFRHSIGKPTILREPIQTNLNKVQFSGLENVIVENPGEKCTKPLVEDDDIVRKCQILQDGSLTKAFQIFEPIQNSSITKELQNFEEPVPLIRKDTEIFEKSVHENSQNLGQGESKILEHPISDGTIQKNLKLLKEPIRSVLSADKDTSLVEQPIQDGVPTEELQVLQQPIQDCANTGESGIPENPVYNNTPEKDPQILEQFRQEESEILDQPIHDDHFPEQPEVVEQSSQNDFKAEPSHGESIAKDLNNSPHGVEVEIVEESIYDDPIPEEPHVLEQPTQSDVNAEEPITEESFHNDLIQEQPQVLEQPTQDGLNAEKPIQDGTIVVDSIAKKFDILEEANCDNPKLEKSQVLEQSTQNDSNAEEGIREESIVKSSQILNSSPELEKSEIQKQPIHKYSHVLEQTTPDSLGTEEPIQDDFIMKSPQILDDSLIAEDSEIENQPIEDGSMPEEAQDLKQSTQDCGNAEKPIQDGVIVKEPGILDKSPITEEFEILEQPIQDDSSLEERQLLKQPSQDSVSAEQPIQDCLKLKDPQILNNNPVVEKSEILKQPIQNCSIPEKPQVLIQPTQDSFITSEFKDSKESIQDNPIMKGSQILDETVPSVQEHEILKKPVGGILNTKQLQVVLTPLPTDLVENMSQCLEKPIKVYFDRKTIQISKIPSLQSSIHHEPKMCQNPTRANSVGRQLRILENRVLKEADVLLQTPVQKVYKLLEKPVPRAMEKFKNLENTSQVQPKILKKILESPLEKKHKLSENFETFGSTSKKKSEIVESPAKKKRQMVVEKSSQSTFEVVSNPLCVEQEHNILEKSVLSMNDVETKILEHSTESNTVEPRIGIPVPKIFNQNHVKRETAILKKSSRALENDANLVDKNGHDMVENHGGGPVEMVSIQDSDGLEPSSSGKYLQTANEKEPIIEQNSAGANGHNVLEKCLYGTMATGLIENSIEQEPNIVEKSPNANKRKPRVIPTEKSHLNFVEHKSSIVANPIESKRRKIMKEPLESAIEEVKKIREKFQQVFKNVAVETLFENDPFEDTSENKLETVLGKPIIEKKVLHGSGSPTENEPESLKTPLQDNKPETSLRAAKLIKHRAEKELHTLQDPIQAQNLEKLIQDTIFKEPISSSKASDLKDTFQKEMDATPTSDPHEDEFCRIHKNSTAVPGNQIPKRKIPIAALTVEPFFKEPTTKKLCIANPEEEELDFRGFTWEEQNRPSNLQSVFDSRVSVLDRPSHILSILDSPISVMESVRDAPSDVVSVRDSVISVMETDYSESLHNTPLLDRSKGLFNGPTKLNRLNKVTTRRYKCNRCDFHASKSRLLKVHLRAHLQPFWCNLCVESFTKIHDLEYHVKNYHSSDGNDYKVGKNKTNDGNLDVITLGRSLRNRQNSEKPSKKMYDQAYKCGFCDYSSSYITRLQKHVQVHTKEKVYSCDQCDYATLTKWMIERHKSDHVAGTQQYECEECGYITMYRSNLDDHLKIHSGLKVYKCDYCLFSTAHFGYFKAHVSFHRTKTECLSEYDDGDDEEEASQTAYKCQQCEYYIRHHTMLWKHAKKRHSESKFIKVIAIHNNKEMYVCNFCGFNTLLEDALNKHMMEHTNLLRNKCKFCDFIADSAFNLQVHEMNHASKNSFKCMKCRRTFTTLQQQTSHVLNVHNVQYVSVE